MVVNRRCLKLARRGYPTVEEPGRRIVKEQLLSGGTALPWTDGVAFARRCIALALSDRRAARRLQDRWVFFDRGLVDASVALHRLTGEPVLNAIKLAPPWPEIYVTDNERRHSLDAGIAEYQRLVDAYPVLGYEVTILPKNDVLERAEFVLRTLAG